MNVRMVLVGLAAAGLLGAMLGGFPSQAKADMNCIQCHRKPAPRWGDKPDPLKVDSFSSFSGWEKSELPDVGETRTADYTYVSACQTFSKQQVITYPEDPIRQKYMYMYSPRTGQFWARCEIDRPKDAPAEWSFRIEGKWQEKKQSNIPVPGTKTKLADPPPLAPL